VDVRVLILTLELSLPGLRGLKERRSVLEPLKQRLRRDLNLSVSEMPSGDRADRARLGIAAVVQARAQGDAQLEKIRSMVDREHRLTVLEEEFEYW